MGELDRKFLCLDNPLYPYTAVLLVTQQLATNKQQLAHHMAICHVIVFFFRLTAIVLNHHIFLDLRKLPTNSFGLLI